MRGTKPHLRTDPMAIDVPDAPEWLSESAAEEWDRVMPILTTRRILTDADLGSLENYAVAMGTVRDMKEHLHAHGYIIVDLTGAMKRNPAVCIQSDAMTHASLLAAERGLTPVSRSRPAIRDDEDEDELSQLD